MLATAQRTLETIQVDRVDESGFAGLREEWSELLQHSDSDCLFLTWEWLHTWWKHLAEDRRLSIIAVRRDGELIGLAPLVVRSRALSHAHPFRVAEFLGNGYAGSDYLDVIVRRGAEDDATESVAAVLERKRFMLKLTNLSSDPAIAGVASSLRGTGWSYGHAVTNVSPYVPLAGKTWDSYIAELGSEHRYNFHRKLRRLNRDFKVDFDCPETPAQCREAIDLVIKLHLLRRSTLGGSDAFHSTALTDFHREFVALALDRGWLRLYVLRLNGQPVACLYGFLYHGKFYFYQTGFDPAFERYSPGLIVTGLSIQAAIAEGASEYDFLHGDEPYKSHWCGSSRRELTRIELFPRGALGRSFHTA